jgi:NAD(P)H dehydrogenase (quinone)
MARVLVLFHSRTGDTAALADAIAEGARGVRFTEVDVRRLDDPAPGGIEAGPGGQESRERLRRYRTLDDVSAVADYDALVLGGPIRDGAMAAEVERFLDGLGPLWEQGALADTVGAAFTSARPGPGGHEPTLAPITTRMAGLGMLLVPSGYTDPTTVAGGPRDATATADGGPTGADLAAARRQGARVAKVAGWVRHAKGHEAADGGHHHHH